MSGPWKTEETHAATGRGPVRVLISVRGPGPTRDFAAINPTPDELRELRRRAEFTRDTLNAGVQLQQTAPFVAIIPITFPSKRK